VYGWLPRAWLTAGTLRSRSSTGSMPIASASAVHHLLDCPCALGVAGRAEGREGPALMKASSLRVRTLGQV